MKTLIWSIWWTISRLVATLIPMSVGGFMMLWVLHISDPLLGAPGIQSSRELAFLVVLSGGVMFIVACGVAGSLAIYYFGIIKEAYLHFKIRLYSKKIEFSL